jgi:thiol-disulfide isomerase/thioredoxin
VTQAAGPASGSPRRLHERAGLYTWLLAGVVVALGGTLLLVKVVGGGSTLPTVTSLAPASPLERAEVTNIPASVYDEVGVASPVVPVVAPVLVASSTARADSARDPSKPVVLFVGTEYCSFCAAERWPLIAALSRFGTFGTLYDVESTAIDYAPDTPTFSFYGTKYTSSYLTFHAYELKSDVLGNDGYLPLMRLPSSEHAIVARYDPTMRYPFVDVGGAALVLQAGLSPETFVGTSRQQVAGGLANPADPVTQAIVASANYLTAAICDTDGERPAGVCSSAGVAAADVALGLPT